MGSEPIFFNMCGTRGLAPSTCVGQVDLVETCIPCVASTCNHQMVAVYLYLCSCCLYSDARRNVPPPTPACLSAGRREGQHPSIWLRTQGLCLERGACNLPLLTHASPMARKTTCSEEGGCIILLHHVVRAVVSKRAALEEGAGSVAKPMELESVSESGIVHDVKWTSPPCVND